MLLFNPTIGLASGHPVDNPLPGPAQQPLGQGGEKEHNIGKLLRLTPTKGWSTCPIMKKKNCCDVNFWMMHRKIWGK
jgi:hypothetical protein